MADTSRFRTTFRVPPTSPRGVSGSSRVYPQHAGDQRLTTLPVLGRQSGSPPHYRVQMNLRPERLRSVWGENYLYSDNPHASWLKSPPALLLSPVPTATRATLVSDADDDESVLVGSDFEYSLRSSELPERPRTPHIRQPPNTENDPSWNPGSQLEMAFPFRIQGHRRLLSSPPSPQLTKRRRVEGGMQSAHQTDHLHQADEFNPCQNAATGCDPQATSQVSPRRVIVDGQRMTIQELLDYTHRRWQERKTNYFIPFLNALGPAEFELAEGAQYALEQERYLETVANIEGVIAGDSDPRARAPITSPRYIPNLDQHHGSFSEKNVSGQSSGYCGDASEHRESDPGSGQRSRETLGIANLLNPAPRSETARVPYRRRQNRNSGSGPTRAAVQQTPARHQAILARWQAEVGMGFAPELFDTLDSRSGNASRSSSSLSSTPSIDSQGNSILPSIEHDCPAKEESDSEYDCPAEEESDSEYDLEFEDAERAREEERRMAAEAQAELDSNLDGEEYTDGDFEDAERAREEERRMATEAQAELDNDLDGEEYIDSDSEDENENDFLGGYQEGNYEE